MSISLLAMRLKLSLNRLENGGLDETRFFADVAQEIERLRPCSP